MPVKTTYTDRILVIYPQALGGDQPSDYQTQGRWARTVGIARQSCPQCLRGPDRDDWLAGWDAENSLYSAAEPV